MEVKKSTLRLTLLNLMSGKSESDSASPWRLEPYYKPLQLLTPFLAQFFSTVLAHLEKGQEILSPKNISYYAQRL